MKITEVYELMEKFEQSSLEKISLELDGMKFSAEKSSGQYRQCEPSEGVRPKENTLDKKEESNGAVVTAPFIGTFYHAKAPGEAPFVSVGQAVKKGDVVGIIEAMKLMNEITAPQDGVVSAIKVADGEMVEFGEVLIQMV